MTNIEFPKQPMAFLVFILKGMPPRHKYLVLGMMLITLSVVISNICILYGFQLLVDRIPTSNSQYIWQDLAYPFGDRKSVV